MRSNAVFNAAMRAALPTPRRSANVAAVTSDPDEVVGHRIESRMDHFVIHREDEHRMETTLERSFELVSGFAVDVSRLALRRSMGLRLQRWHAEDRHPGFG